MDVMATILRDLNRFPRRRPRAVREILDLEKVMEGKWSADDLLECMVDEVSTSAAAGSGTDRPIGVSDWRQHIAGDEEYEDDLNMGEVVIAARRVIRKYIGEDGDINLAVHRYLEAENPGRNTKPFRKLVLSTLRGMGY